MSSIMRMLIERTFQILLDAYKSDYWDMHPYGDVPFLCVVDGHHPMMVDDFYAFARQLR